MKNDKATIEQLKVKGTIAQYGLRAHIGLLMFVEI